MEFENDKDNYFLEFDAIFSKFIDNFHKSPNNNFGNEPTDDFVQFIIHGDGNCFYYGLFEDEKINKFGFFQELIEIESKYEQANEIRKSIANYLLKYSEKFNHAINDD